MLDADKREASTSPNPAPPTSVQASRPSPELEARQAAERAQSVERLKAEAVRPPAPLDDAESWAREAAARAKIEELTRKHRAQIEAEGRQRENLNKDPSVTDERLAELQREYERRKADAAQVDRKEAQLGGGAPGTIEMPSVLVEAGVAFPSGWTNAGRSRFDSLESEVKPALKQEGEKLDAQVRGSAGVSSPDRAKEGEAFNVVLQVGPDRTAPQLLRSLKQEAPENAVLKARDEVILTLRMSASLTGHGFEILPKETLSQEVSAGEPTTWTWTVKPVESGNLTLTFTLSRILFSEGKEAARHYSYRQNVHVEVSPMRLAEKYWPWLATTLAIPLVLWGWTLWKKPSDGTEPKPAQKLTPAVRRRDGRHG